MVADQKQDLKYWLALNRFSKFGPARLGKLLAFFGSPDAILSAPASELINAGIEAGLAAEFLIVRSQLQPDRLLSELEREQVKLLLLGDPAYPANLKEIHLPPRLLYYKGKLGSPEEINLAVVGARKFSSYGKQVAESLVFELAKAGLTIVSGLALGIDSLAHSAALSAGGRTIAVLGSGLDRQSIYPSSNRYLADKIIAEDGLILSEFPLGTEPLKHNFPQRNRLISGLSVGTLVIEANEKSGSLITAKFALEQNREVLAVPGSIYNPTSTGTNWLIKQGAAAVTKATDVLDALDLSAITHYTQKEKLIPQTEAEGRILPFLCLEAIHIDQLVRQTGLTSAEISSELILMEMRGAVKNLGGMMYVLAR
jgi:DNA processing protein